MSLVAAGMLLAGTAPVSAAQSTGPTPVPAPVSASAPGFVNPSATPGALKPSTVVTALLFGCTVWSQLPGSASNVTATLDGETYTTIQAGHSGPLFIFRDGQWVQSGWIQVYVDSSVQGNPSVGASWGSFYTNNTLGEFFGEWSWDWGLRRDGYGAAYSSTSDRTLAVKFLLNDPVNLPPPPTDPCGGPPPVAGYRYLRLAVS